MLEDYVTKPFRSYTDYRPCARTAHPSRTMPCRPTSTPHLHSVRWRARSRHRAASVWQVPTRSGYSVPTGRRTCTRVAGREPRRLAAASLLNLPSHLDECVKRRALPSRVLKPISFGNNGDIITTSTTRWLGKVDRLYWQVGPSKDDRKLTKTVELLPGLEGCEAMLPLHHLAVDDSTLVLCTHEAARPAITERTSVRGLNTSSLTVTWTAKPIPGQVRTLHHIPSLNSLVLSAAQDVTNHYEEDRESLQICTAIVVLDAHCFVSPDSDNPVVGLAWQKGDVLTVGLNKFIADGFEREGEGERARTLALFPAELIAASLGRKEIVAVAGVKKHPVISEGSREEDIPDWEEEEGKVMFAKW
ncbi:hypothetical protein B0H19DRAFT_1316820 [Mycena capillaripes]|nr:hypothetical protein B0H19DRAFT_1316820 [Mycena capillaripes]